MTMRTDRFDRNHPKAVDKAVAAIDAVAKTNGAQYSHAHTPEVPAQSIDKLREAVDRLATEFDVGHKPEIITGKPLTYAEHEREKVDEALQAPPDDFANAKQRPKSQHVEYKRERISALPTSDLIDLMIAIGIEMGQRRA